MKSGGLVDQLDRSMDVAGRDVDVAVLDSSAGLLRADESPAEFRVDHTFILSAPKDPTATEPP